MLVYVDRPARISGNIRVKMRTIRYDVQVEHPGYVWIGPTQALGAQTRSLLSMRQCRARRRSSGGHPN